MQLVLFGMRVIGPPAAGILVRSFGPTSCYALDSVSFVCSAAIIASVFFLDPDERVRAHLRIQRDNRDGISPRTLSTDLAQSIRFIAQYKILVFVVLAMAVGLFVVGCFLPSLSVYTHENLSTSTKLFGRLSRFLGLGMLLGVIALNKFGKSARSTKLVYVGLIGLVAGFLTLASGFHISSSLLAVFLVGASLAAIIIPSQAMVQQLTPAPLIGRVGAVFMSTIFMAQVLGLALSAVLMRKMAPRSVFLLCACLPAVLAAVAWLRSRPSVRCWCS
jgi:MFS family permease